MAIVTGDVQTQNDVYGAVVLAISQAFFDERLGQPGDRYLFERLELVRLRPVTILDLGAGTGTFTAALAKRYRRARVVGLDLATQMLRQGASLAEIGQLLRHQHPDTTRIYAQVDLPALRKLAPPWPGGAR